MFQRFANANANSEAQRQNGRAEASPASSPAMLPQLFTGLSATARRDSAASSQVTATKSRAGSVSSAMLLGGSAGPAFSPRSPQTLNSSMPTTPGASAEEDPSHLMIIECLAALQALGPADVAVRLVTCSQISALLAEYPATRDTFRTHHGFNICVTMLSSSFPVTDAQPPSTISANAEAPIAETASTDAMAIDASNIELHLSLVSGALAMISRAVEDHPFNKRYLDRKIGYAALYDAMSASATYSDQTPHRDHLLGILLSFTTGFTRDRVTKMLFTNARMACMAAENGFKDDLNGSRDSSRALPDSSSTALHEVVAGFLQTQSGVHNAAGAVMMVKLLKRFRDDSVLRRVVLEVLDGLAASSYANCILLTGSELLAELVTWLWPSHHGGHSSPAISDDLDSRKNAFSLAKRLLIAGVSTSTLWHIARVAMARHSNDTSKSTVDDGSWLDLLNLMLEAVSRLNPPVLHFDSRAASLGDTKPHMPSLSLPFQYRQFPPYTNNGYTFASWIRIDRFASTDQHMPLWTVRDDARSASPSVCLGIDLASRTLMVHTNGHLEDPGVSVARLPYAFITEQCWTHVAVVHRRGSRHKLSEVDVLLDGQLVADKVPLDFPHQPDGRSSVAASSGFAGGSLDCAWSLGPTCCYDGELSADMLYVIYSLEPTYIGNYQDRLGRFQTYASSSLINLQIEKAYGATKHAGQSALVGAIRGASAAFIDERKLYFNTNATSLAYPQAASDASVSQPVITSESNEYPASGILEAVIPQNSDDGRLAKPAETRGFVHYCVPRYIDAGFDKVGGACFLCHLIADASTSTELEAAFCLFERAITSSWRVSEDAERTQAYEIIALLLRQKQALLSVKLLKSVIRLCGGNLSEPNRSVLSNPPAFRFILLDFTIWNNLDPLIQLLHLQQVSAFVSISAHSKFNARRLSRMHVVPKILQALRDGSTKPGLVPAYIDCLIAFLTSHWRTETIRQVATFLSATLCSGGSSPTQTVSQDIEPVAYEQIDPEDPRFAGVTLLRAVHDIFFGRDAYTMMAKWASTVTSRWINLFFSPETHLSAVVLALRMLSRLLRSQSPSYTSRYSNVTNGFRIMRDMLPTRWYSAPLLSTLLHLWAGLDTPPFDAEIDAKALVRDVRQLRVTSLTAPVLEVILAIVKAGADDIIRRPAAAADRINYLASLVQCLRAVTAASSDHARVAKLSCADIVEICGNAGIDAFDLSTDAQPASVFPLVSSTSDWCFSHSATTIRLKCAKTDPALDADALLTARIALGAEVLDPLYDIIAHDTLQDPHTMLTILNNAQCEYADEEIAVRSALTSKVLVQLQDAHWRQWLANGAPLISAIVKDILAGLQHDHAVLRTLLIETVEEAITGGLDERHVRELQRSLHRLLLFALSQSDSQQERTSPLLKAIVHYCVCASMQKSPDLDFVRCVLFRYVTALQTGGENSSNLTEAIKCLLSHFQGVTSDGGTVNEILQSSSAESLNELCGSPSLYSALESSWLRFEQREKQVAILHLLQFHTQSAALASARVLKLEQRRRHTMTSQGKTQAWSSLVTSVETSRFRAAIQDARDHIDFIAEEWVRLQTDLLALLAPETLINSTFWMLDRTEGPARLRKKMTASIVQRANIGSKLRQSLHVAAKTALVHDALIDKDSFSTGQPPDSPSTPHDENSMWSDLGDLPDAQQSSRPRSLSEPVPDDGAILDNQDEDKNRKVLRCLEPGDRVQAVYNAHRIVGLSAVGGLLLLGAQSLYIIDGYQQSRSGEVLDSADIPPDERDQALETVAELARLSTRPRTMLPVKLARHKSRSWTYDQLIRLSERKYIFRDNAMELSFVDGRSYLLVVAPGLREEVLQSLAPHLKHPLPFCVARAAAKGHRTRLHDDPELHAATKRWLDRRISNAEYIMVVNHYSGRTYNDITAYPVFPWVIADWDSENLDLASPSTFRIMSLPMGAQTQARRYEFEERFQAMQEFNDASVAPAHYLTHFSSAMIVAGFLIRLRPFTDMFLDLQGGNFDHADRAFYTWKGAWESASALSRSDVRELVPELYALPQFLTNENDLDLGVLQGTDARIDSVQLPPWAQGSTRLFLQRHREALESEYIGMRLHYWVDLIFGCLQRSVDDCNVYQSLSYDGAINLDEVENANERAAATATIHSFGATPTQLFTTKHPARTPLKTEPWTARPGTFDIENVPYLNQAMMPVAERSGAAEYLQFPSSSSPSVHGYQTIETSSNPRYRVTISHRDRSLRLSGSGKEAVIEGIDAERTTCLADVDGTTIAIAAASGLLYLLKISEEAESLVMPHVCTLRGHASAITALRVSRAWSIIVTGAQDGTAIIWDLNRMRLVHRLHHTLPVRCISISESTGDIAVACGNELLVYDINGHPLVRQHLYDTVTSCTFTTHFTSPLLVTGHSGSKICIWGVVFDKASNTAPEFQLVLLRVLQQHFRFDIRQDQPSTAITCLEVTSAGLYAGDSAGRVGLWNLPGKAHRFHDSTTNACLLCNERFGFLERRIHQSSCASCGINCCSRPTCSGIVPQLPAKYCVDCVQFLLDAKTVVMPKVQ